MRRVINWEQLTTVSFVPAVSFKPNNFYNCKYTLYIKFPTVWPQTLHLYEIWWSHNDFVVNAKNCECFLCVLNVFYSLTLKQCRYNFKTEIAYTLISVMLVNLISAFLCFQGKTKRDQSLEELRQHIHRYYMPLSRQLMVLFPEGGFLHKRREVSQRLAGSFCLYHWTSIRQSLTNLLKHYSNISRLVGFY